VSAPTPYTWVCSGCGRNVPLRVARCHCGASREQAETIPEASAPPPSSDGLLVMPGWRGVWRTLPRDVKAMVVTAAALVLGGVAWLLASPPRTDFGPALLGQVERPLSPKPQPPAFKLPWWN
jgi:hypothetical protein